ncbi:MAG TPA: hypothetical protein VHY84_09305 [Bryobacteraceae bacterium]|nr:hypothetical protein [Bryobacteraceae bacterium]
MLSRPDVVVGKPESSEVLLAVEVKSVAAQASVDGLKEYMVRQNCPAGVLVSPETILFLTNRYTEFQPSSIEQTGTCATSELLGQTAGRRQTESDLVERVVLWLDTLAAAPRSSWPPCARESIETLVLPAVLNGVLRSAGKRLRRAS